jgi:tetratricopeptide (TPR) repeat protein
MYVRAPRPELYDLDKDQGELDNVIAAHPREYRKLAGQLKKLSRLGTSGTETVQFHNMDRRTMEQLESLGYVSGVSAHKIELNGTGSDPKDHLATLKVLETIAYTPHISAAREIELLRQVLPGDSTNPTLYQWLIDAYEREGRYPEAMQACQDALHHGIWNGNILSHIAELYLRQGKRDQAIAYYKKAAQLEPLDVQGQANLATAYLNSGRLADAKRAFQWALTIQRFVPAYNGLGIVAMKQHHLPEARKNFEQAVHLDPDYVEAQLNLGILCTQTRDFSCARAAFKVFLKHAPRQDYKDMIPRVRFALAHMNDAAK